MVCDRVQWHACCCVHGNEPSISIKCDKFIEQCRHHLSLKKAGCVGSVCAKKRCRD